MSLRFYFEQPAPTTVRFVPDAHSVAYPSYRLATGLSWADRRGISLPVRAPAATVRPGRLQALIARLESLLATISWPAAADIWVDVPMLDLHGLGYPLLLDPQDRDRNVGDRSDRDRNHRDRW